VKKPGYKQTCVFLSVAQAKRKYQASLFFSPCEACIRLQGFFQKSYFQNSIQGHFSNTTVVSVLGILNI